MRIKLDRTVCDGFGACAVHAPEVFSLDDWGYPSLVGGEGEVAPEREAAVRRALLDCPAHAIVELGATVPLAAGGEPAMARNAGPDAPWSHEPPPTPEAPWAAPAGTQGESGYAG